MCDTKLAVRKRWGCVGAKDGLLEPLNMLHL